MSEPATAPEFRPLGVDGVLIRFARVLSEDANQRMLAFRDLVTQADLPGVTVIASALTSLRVGFDPNLTDRAHITTALRALLDRPHGTDAMPRRLWRIPTAFGPDHAPQLEEAATLAGLTTTQAIAEIEAQTLHVLAIGFAPGQPFLGMLPEHWNLPRQAELTPHMPSGALVAAVRQLIIFCADAPTGWRHIGQTAFQVYRPDAADPFAFTAGDAVQFCAVSDTEFRHLKSGANPDGGATCTVLR